MIPLDFLHRIVDLLGYWDISNYDPVIQLEHFELLRFLSLKKRRLDLRDDYAKIIRANNSTDRNDARISYLQHRGWLRADERDNSL
jgi:hypothetical protein